VIVDPQTWPDSKPCEAGLFWTVEPAWWSWAIRRITGSPWSHIGVWFGWPDGSRQRAEALTDGAFSVGKGIAGPRSWISLCLWVWRAAGRRACWCCLTMDGMAASAMYDEARVLQRFASYSEMQLLGLWWRERWRKLTGFDPRPLRDTPTKLVCSEYASRVSAAGMLSLTDATRERHDEVTPGSAMYVCETRYRLAMHEIGPEPTKAQDVVWP